MEKIPKLCPPRARGLVGSQHSSCQKEYSRACPRLDSSLKQTFARSEKHGCLHTPLSSYSRTARNTQHVHALSRVRKLSRHIDSSRCRHQRRQEEPTFRHRSLRALCAELRRPQYNRSTASALRRSAAAGMPCSVLRVVCCGMQLARKCLWGEHTMKAVRVCATSVKESSDTDFSKQPVPNRGPWRVTDFYM